MGSKGSKQSNSSPKRIVFKTELSETEKIMEIQKPKRKGLFSAKGLLKTTSVISAVLIFTFIFIPSMKRRSLNKSYYEACQLKDMEDEQNARRIRNEQENSENAPSD